MMPSVALKNEDNTTTIPYSNTNYTGLPNPSSDIEVPSGIEPPKCDCDCHPSSILRNTLIFLEDKIGIIKCCHCNCWG